MISYRKLAMRVLGHPLRVPTNTPRPAFHRVTALALTAAMVAGMAAPAYAGTYYIGDGDITITKDEKGDVYVKHADNKDKSNGDVDNGDIIIKGGTPATSAAKSASATLKVEDSENEDKDMVYPGDTKGSDSSDGGGEENDPKPGGTPTPAEGTESTESNRSAPESQFTYTGASLNVASSNDDEETRNESTTVLKRAAENFKNTAENVTNYVIRIINKATGNDNTLNVTLDNVNITAKNDAPSASRARATRKSRSEAAIPLPTTSSMPASSTTKRARMAATPAN